VVNMLVGMSLWILLLFAAIGIFSSIFTFRKRSKNEVRRGIYLGIFLLVFDYIFETAGYYLNLWEATGSVFRLGAPPIEVLIIAFLAGFTYTMLFEKKFKLYYGLATSLLIAVVGTSFEALLISEGLLIYSGGWTSYHALVSYFVTFLLMHKINSIV